MLIRQSQIKQWMSCPLKFKFSQEGAERDQSSALSFGSVIHDAVLVMETAPDNNLARGIQRFDDMWDNLSAYAQATCQPIQPGQISLAYDYLLPRNSHDGYRDMGHKILRDWWSLIQWESDVVLAREYQFTVPIGTNELTGTVDKLALRPLKGREFAVLISDYKCLDPQTRVLMATGEIKTADAIQTGDLIVGGSEKHNEALTVTRVLAVIDNGIQDRFRVTTRGGRTIVVTGNHPFLTQRGWVETRNLLPVADMAMVALDWEGTAIPSITTDEAWLLGFLIGDGSLSGTSVGFSCTTPEMIEKATRIFDHMECDVHRTGQTNDYYAVTRATGKGSRLNAKHQLFSRKHGLRGTNSHTKSVPKAVMTGGPEVWAAFVAGYFDTDGAVREPDRTKFDSDDLHIASVNQTLLTDVQTVLANLGIRASLYPVRAKYKDEPYTSYRLGVRDQHGAYALSSLLIQHSAHPRKRDRMKEIVAQGRRVDRPQNYAHDPIKTVERLPYGPTIGLTVGTGVHVTAGLLTHNTSAKQPTRDYLQHDVQFHAYCYATTQPEFWVNLPDGEKLYQLYKDAPRLGEWVHLRNTKRIDAGFREEVHYNRLNYAIEQIELSVAMGIFVPDISGTSCEYCEFRQRCGLPSREQEGLTA